jgi:uncharacterized membrane protein
MAFRKLKYYENTLQSVDPRLDPEYVINSNYCLVTITPFPTYKTLLANNPAGISETKMLGIITNYNRSENVAINVLYDIGNASPILIPGKMSPGQVTLSSDMMECVNLLGLMYETILENAALTGKFSGITDQILAKPKLTETYYEDSSISKSTKNQATAVPATPASPGGIEPPGYIDTGALLMSLGDRRLRLKFGLSFILLQSEKRIKGGITNQKADFQITTNDFSNTFTETRQSIKYGAYVEPTKVNYRILSGIFLENCIIQSYGTGINPNSTVSTPVETVSVIYGSSKNIKSTIS